MDFSHAIGAIAIGGATAFALWKTSEPRCLWALVLIPILFDSHF
jgi:hypothetical protein